LARIVERSRLPPMQLHHSRAPLHHFARQTSASHTRIMHSRRRRRRRSRLIQRRRHRSRRFDRWQLDIDIDRGAHDTKRIRVGGRGECTSNAIDSHIKVHTTRQIVVQLDEVRREREALDDERTNDIDRKSQTRIIQTCIDFITSSRHQRGRTRSVALSHNFSVAVDVINNHRFVNIIIDYCYYCYYYYYCCCCC
jgi:hypothetical protein